MPDVQAGPAQPLSQMQTWHAGQFYTHVMRRGANSVQSPLDR